MPRTVEKPARNRGPAAAIPVFALLGAIALPAAAQAQETTVMSAGQWSVFTGIGDGNRHVCGLVSNEVGGRRVILQIFAGDHGLTIQAVKESWNIPPNTPVSMVLNVDGTTTWNEQTNGGSQVAGFQLLGDAASAFEVAMRNGNTLNISFPGGNEPPWATSLSGSSAAFNSFDSCRYAMNGPPGAGGPTQPYAAPPTQPNAPPPPAAPQPGAPLPPLPQATQPNAPPA